MGVMTDNTILVLAATGKTGRRVSARLRLLGARVRPASRSSETRFDWSDPDGWEVALEGVSSVYLVPPTEVGPVEEFIARAEDAGVRRLVLLSGRGADTWGESAFGLDMRDAERAVRASALDWTIVRANNFQQNFDEDPLFTEPLAAGELALPAGGVPEPFVDIEDVAAVVAAVLTSTAHAGRTYELTGPRALTWREAVGLIAAAAGRTIRYREVSIAEYADAAVAAGWPREDADAVAAMYEIMARGLLSEPTDDVSRVLGRAPAAFEDYVVRTAAAGRWRV